MMGRVPWVSEPDPCPRWLNAACPPLYHAPSVCRSMKGMLQASLTLFVTAGAYGQCGSSPSTSCCEVQRGPGCNDAACCTLVCATDPFCCIEVWDALCVNLAADRCAGCPAGPPPANDTCPGALPIGLGDTPFDTRSALTDGPPDPDCASPVCAGDIQVHMDVWFRYTAADDGALLVSACDSPGLDVRIAVYPGCDCGNLVNLTQCNDSSGDCADPRVAMTVAAGNCYLIRVGTGDGLAGTGTLRLADTGRTGCPAQAAAAPPTPRRGATTWSAATRSA